MESREITRIVHASLGQYFDRPLAVHELVLGQIDRAHSATADEPEHAILAEREAAILFFHQLLDVPGREELAVDHEVGEQVGVGGHLAAMRLLEFVERRLQRLRFDELAALDVIEKALNRESRHIAVGTAVSSPLVPRSERPSATRANLRANLQALPHTPIFIDSRTRVCHPTSDLMPSTAPNRRHPAKRARQSDKFCQAIGKKRTPG